MIGTSISLGIWTSGLMWMTTREEKKRLLMISEDTANAKEENIGQVDPGRFEEKV